MIDLTKVDTTRIPDLLDWFKQNSESILKAIHNDPKLQKRICPETGVVIANASKALFSPEHPHQLFAKGIIYDPETWELVGMPYLKIYNWGEKPFVGRFVQEAIAEGAMPIFNKKEDGSFVSRSVVKGRVIFSARGSFETTDPEKENFKDYADNHRLFFEQVHEMARAKYPILLDPDFAWWGTVLLELVGPKNRIITHYPETDLILTGVFDNVDFRYHNREELRNLQRFYGLNLCEAYSPEGDTIEKRVQDLNRSLSDTDQEGAVVTFELKGEVLGRVKVKTETYRQIMWLISGFSYDDIVEILEKNPDITSWQELEAYFKALGSDRVPEELLAHYQEFYQRYVDHAKRCEEVVEMVNENYRWVIWGMNADGNNLSRAQRKELSSRLKELPWWNLYFEALDDKLSARRIREWHCRTPEESMDLWEEIKNSRIFVT